MPTKKILAIGPHPDDLEFGAGAILIKEVKHGHRVEMFVLSRGEAATNGPPKVRQAEAEKAAELIDAKLVFGDFGGDCHIAYSIDSVLKVAREIRRFKPSIVLVNSPEENQHPDHVESARIVRAACRLARYGGIKELNDVKPHVIDILYFYPATLNAVTRPDIVIDVSQEVTRWQKVMAAHQSQLKTKKYIDLVLARAKVLGLSINAQYALGLYASDSIILDTPSSARGSARNF